VIKRVEVDLLVIGFGKAGKTLAATLGRMGRRVALVEQSAAMYGGTCINIACVPTKALIHDADARRADDDGVAWYAQAVERKDGITTAMRAKNFDMLDRLDSVLVVTGRAEFTDRHAVRVTGGADELLITALTIVINTGSVPVIPQIPGATANGRVHTSTTLLDQRARPLRLAIVGGGYIGLEFASMYRAFGSDVTVLESGPAILEREDDDVAAAVRRVLDDDGIRIMTGAAATEIASDNDHAVVTYERDGATDHLAVDAVLLAVGRRAATDGLNLDAAGVRVDDRGAVVVDEFLRTTADGIYAVGDVNGGRQFTYISLDDYRIVLDQLIGAGQRSTRDRAAVPHTLFLTPPLSTVGQTERDAVAAGMPIRVARKNVDEIATMPRPRIVGETRGLIKFVIDAESDEVLGASLFCIDSQEFVNLVALAMRQHVTAAELRDGIWIHPSTSESLNEVLGAAEPVDAAQHPSSGPPRATSHIDRR
jgi:pyruvate/2-oxoglutarate dehydrogenase complex dihydrolipoamide dehydrogenase (E3) component